MFTNSQLYVHADELLHLRLLPRRPLLQVGLQVLPPVQLGGVAELLQVVPVVVDVLELVQPVPAHRILLVGGHLAVAAVLFWFFFFADKKSAVRLVAGVKSSLKTLQTSI